MKHTTRKHIKAIPLCLIALLLTAFMLVCLVACGENDNGTTPGGTTLGDGDDTPQTAQLVTLFEKLIGYTLANGSDSNEIMLGLIYYNDNGNSYEEISDFGEGILGYIVLSLENDDTNCYAFIYENSAQASSCLDSVQDFAEYVYQSENLIIAETVEGFYNSTLNTASTEGSISVDALNFIKSNLQLAIADDVNNSINFLTVGEYLSFENAIYPIIGNCESSFYYCSDSAISAEI